MKHTKFGELRGSAPEQKLLWRDKPLFVASKRTFSAFAVSWQVLKEKRKQ